MSIKVDINNLSEQVRKRITKELSIKLVEKTYGRFSKSRYIYPFEIVSDDWYLPYNYAASTIKSTSPKRSNYSKRNIKYVEPELFEKQKEVKKEALTQLNKTGTSFLALHVGFGKTIMSIYIASIVKMRTLIIIHRIVIMEQWERTIKRCCPDSTVQIVTSTSTMDDCDFYIMNAINVPKMGADFYTDIGLVIVDEAHLILAEVFSKSLACLTPKYLIGLSGTPYRQDGMDILFELYFNKNKIIRKLWRQHYVYKIDTGFKPVVEMASNGKVDWSKVIDSQAHDHDRNELFIRLIKQFKKRNFLVLCKRVKQARHLLKRLQEEGEDVTSLIGTQQVFNRESRILVATAQKVSVGFDHPKLDTLLLAGDILQYYLQCIGRILRTKETPIIFDPVDNYSILKRHFNERKKVCIEHGGELRSLKRDCPDFFT